MSKKTEEMLAKDQKTTEDQINPAPPTKEQLEEIRLTLMIPALQPLGFYSPSAQIERLEEKVNEIAIKVNTLVNMLMGTIKQ